MTIMHDDRAFRLNLDKWLTRVPDDYSEDCIYDCSKCTAHCDCYMCEHVTDCKDDKDWRKANCPQENKS